MATSTDELFRQMFRGWSKVETWRGIGLHDDFHVHLTLHPEALQQFREPNEMIDRLWPKKVRLVRMGVRFHGRLVGKR